MAVPSGTGRKWQRQDIKQADYKPFGTLPPFVLQSEGTPGHLLGIWSHSCDDRGRRRILPESSAAPACDTSAGKTLWPFCVCAASTRMLR